MWISPLQVDAIVFFPHEYDCVNQIYGPVAGRTNHFFVRYYLHYDQDGSSNFEFVEVDANDYASHSSGTITELRHEIIYQVCKLNQKLLTKLGRMGGTTALKIPMSSSSFRYIKEKLQFLGGQSITIACRCLPSKQSLVHANLSIGMSRLRTLKTTIIANNIGGFQALRHLFSAAIEAGVKKRHPPIDKINNPDYNPLPLSVNDTINMVDIDLSDLADDIHGGWMDDDAQDKETYDVCNRNFIRMLFDHRLKECTMKIKCMALVVGNCTAPALVNYIAANDDIWGVEDVDQLYVGLEMEIDEEVWMIHQIHEAQNNVTLKKDRLFGQGTLFVSFTFCFDKLA